MKYCLLLLPFLFISFILFGQDSAYQWKVSSKKLAANQYELTFSTRGNTVWQLYAPNQSLSEVPTTEIQFADSAIQTDGNFKESGVAKNEQSALFSTNIKFYNGPTEWKQLVTIKGTIPASLQGTLLYTYGKGEEFYPSISYPFSVPLEGGVQSSVRIKVASIDINRPIVNCGDEDTANQTIWQLFLIGLGAGIVSLSST